MKSLRSVAVLGAGTMGSRIAAHFANAGVPALLLDIVIPGQADRSTAAKKGLESAAKSKPGGFFTADAAALVRTGNFEDHLEQVRDADWILEAVTENLEIKRALWAKVDALRKPGSIVSTNTSGIPLAQIAAGLSDDFRAHFLGTHFFNPPRFLHLAEIIPGPATLPEVLAQVSEFCDRRLGKGVVLCKDTPNFIGNRIGSFFGATVYKMTLQKDDYTVEESGRAHRVAIIGLPQQCQFPPARHRGSGRVGLRVEQPLPTGVPDRSVARPLPDVPAFMHADVTEGRWLGDKTGQGLLPEAWARIGRAPRDRLEDAGVSSGRRRCQVPFDRIGAPSRSRTCPNACVRVVCCARRIAPEHLPVEFV